MPQRAMLILLILLSLSLSAPVQAESAKQLIRQAIDNYRGITSYSEATMTIHRPDWERVMSMQAWTEGLDKSLVRITAPKKDKNGGTLLIADKMWSYAPKINRVIKIPASMSNQSWMGSDFSNNDIARADDIIDNYTHRIIDSRLQDRVKIFTIESVPHENAPVVWGKEIVTVTEDHVFLRHEFYDQDNILIKTLTADEIKLIDGKRISLRQRMQKNGRDNEWTEFYTTLIKFNIKHDKNTFTLANLRNPG
ncbi:MAG: outer membrane lipoprotein-sorting protein [Gammaproteobacteria bacterium]|nr:outer membrane lipoprotein-sorting protein [Gammaproteobacteria bacterium]